MRGTRQSPAAAFSPRPPVAAFPRPILIALFLLLAGAGLEAQLSPPELEDVSDLARRAAKAAVAGPQRVFLEALDADGILEHRLGSTAWKGLTERQHDQLRSIIHEHFVRSLAPARVASSGEIGWSSVIPNPSTGSGADVLIGLKFGDRTLKTRWLGRRAGGGWHIADVVLSDPGISLAEASFRALGPEPVRRRQRRLDAERAAYPRAAALAVIALLVGIVAPRLSPGRRNLLFLTAAAPAVLFAIDGFLAVRRTLSERYALSQPPGRAPWRESERMAIEAEREGRLVDARRFWLQAISQGDPAGPIEYQMGLASRQKGELETARAEFERALAEKPPAPGAAKELAAIDIAQGKYAEASRRLDRYLSLTGPDPETLSMLAVVQTNLGRTAEALEAIRQAQSLIGNGWRGAELEAQVRARAGDAAGAVAALRPLEGQGRLDRSALRADPAYVSIATDPAWVSFLNEKPGRK